MKAIWIFVLACWVAGDASAVTRYVNVNNPSPLSPYTNGWGSAATNIQNAVAIAGSGDLVLVTDGVYRVSQQLTLGAAIAVRSVNGPTSTVVAGNYPVSASRVFEIANAGAVVSGFTISNGVLTAQQVGGAGVLFTANGIVSNCVITQNQGLGNFDMGAGAYMSSAGQLYNCVVKGNRIPSGGQGGGIYIFSYGSTVRNCVVTDNYAYQGGGIYAYSGASYIDNCTIVSNTAGWFGGGINNSASPCKFRNCIIYYNSPDNWSGGALSNCCTFPAGGIRSVTNAPGFLNQGLFRLRSDSMCINAGANQSWMAGWGDLDGQPRVQASLVDIGADESPYAPIDASSAPGGLITPAGRVGVLVSGSQAFTITTQTVYAVIQDVKIDGISIGVTNAYTFYNVTSNHTIEALFNFTYPDAEGYAFAEATCDAANGFVFSWFADDDWRYTLQKSPTLTPAAWSNAPPHTNMTGNGLVVITNNMGSSTRMFYRLMAVPGI